MGDPPGEDEAVAPAGQGGGDVVDDLGVAGLVGDQRTVDLGERTRRGQVDVVVAGSRSRGCAARVGPGSSGVMRRP